jgi:pimeloyl-ACP methyl ester carboxylesterase
MQILGPLRLWRNGIELEPGSRQQAHLLSLLLARVDRPTSKDWGSGQPIVFSHGWPLSADDWDAQMLFFLHHGYRVIAHDPRGSGRSTQVSKGNDMDHYADDLAELTRRRFDLQDAIPCRTLRRRR